MEGMSYRELFVMIVKDLALGREGYFGMNTPPTSPSLRLGSHAADSGVLGSSTQCLARYLAKCGQECPRSPCNAAQDDVENEQLLYTLAGRDVDLMADAKARLSAVPVGKGPYCYVYEIAGAGKVIKFARSRRHSRAVLSEAAVQCGIASRCDHVVPILGVSYVGRAQFSGLRAGECVPGIVMPRMRMDLHQFYRTREHVEVRRLWWRAAQQLLQCLVSLKKQRIVHGDIKTANILLDFESEPNFFLADFSAAKTVPRGRGAICGASIETTMEYCAPETLRESIQSFDTDLYSLGLCLLALVTRQEPFRELQQAKNHGSYSVQQSQWLMNAVLKNDPINMNVLSDSLHRQWSNELALLSLMLVKRLPVEDCLLAISQFHR